MLLLRIENDELIRGTEEGTVRFILENTGDEEIDIVTARKTGNKPSNEIEIKLLDGDGNVFGVTYFRQGVGDKIQTLSNGQSVARIGAGEVFESAPVSIRVPMSAPDEITLKLSITKIYHHKGRPDQVTMEGLSSTREVILSETSYKGEITDITPETSMGGESFIIAGRAIDRTTELPVADVSLNLVITVSGFERSYEVYTDYEGSFAHEFTPLEGEAGLYKVCAIHPDLLDRPVQGTFVIHRVGVNPTTLDVNIPRNYEQVANIKITTGEGTQATDAQLQLQGDLLPQGVHLEIGPEITVGSKTTGKLPFTVWGDNTAEETSTIGEP
jgi:hypothetical protein